MVPGVRGGLVVVGALAATACGGVAQPDWPTLYTVTSIVMQKPGQAPRACFAMPLPLPPIGCGGPELAGFDFLSAPGFTTYPNGVRASGMVRLVGAWDGRRLVLSHPPEAAAVADQTRTPECTQDGTEPQGPGLPPMMQKVADDTRTLQARGILVLEMGMCKRSLFMVVPVADAPTVEYLTQRYGDVIVAGWLQPVKVT